MNLAETTSTISAVPIPKSRVAVYARISTADGRQDSANQLGELRKFATSQHWEIAGEYIDHESGKTADRAEFQRLMADAACRRFDVVLFWALDRFTREGALATLQHLNTLTSYGVGYRSYTEAYLDSCGLFKDAIIAILGTVAKQERIRLSERVRAGLLRAKDCGTRSGRKIGRPRVLVRRDQVLQLRSEGLSWSQIAARTGGSIGTVRRVHRTVSDETRPCQNPSPEAL